MTATAYPLSWPTGWPRVKKRQCASFNEKRFNGHWNASASVTIATALDRLDQQLGLLAAKATLLSCNLERNLSGAPKASQREPEDTGVALYFHLNGKPTVLACDKWDRTADNMVAIAKHIEALRGMERWGVGSLVQAFSGYQQLPAPEQWWQVLGVSQSASQAEIDASFMALAKSAHPDKGGSDAAMARLNLARENGLSTINA